MDPRNHWKPIKTILPPPPLYLPFLKSLVGIIDSFHTRYTGPPNSEKFDKSRLTRFTLEIGVFAKKEKKTFLHFLIFSSRFFIYFYGIKSLLTVFLFLFLFITQWVSALKIALKRKQKIGHSRGGHQKQHFVNVPAFLAIFPFDYCVLLLIKEHYIHGSS